ncbi:MAG: zinc-binding dehydrogenase [Leptospiraceae bacterium]|nr:zinc-binding dehydrogenase [Leptospiraceae bacterium]
MKAAVLHKGEKYLKVEDVPTKELSRGKVKVKIKCCGVCGSDLHLTVHKQFSINNYPVIMGHEASGVVEEVGEGVTKFKKGDRVVINAGVSCGECSYCNSGRPNYCLKKGVLGIDVDGAFAEEFISDEKNLNLLPDSIPFDQGAILADAVSTPYHALKYAGSMKEGEVAVVIGCGGLGIHGVTLARALGASKVVAVDIDRGALENAEKYKADELINVKEHRNLGKVLKEITGGVDVLCDYSGFYKNIEESVRAMNPGGRMVMVGIGRNQMNITYPMQIIDRMITITGSLGCDHRAIPELIQLYTDGKLDLSHSITSHHPLEEINDCLDNLYHRNGNPIRYIIEPGK